MTIYFEAFAADGKQIFGNLDGQGCVLRSVRDYRRTNHYKALKSGIDSPAYFRPKWARVKHWRVCYNIGAGADRELEIIPNPHFIA